MDGFIMENPIKMDDLGVPLFLQTPTSLLLLPIFFKENNQQHQLQHLHYQFTTRIGVTRCAF